MTGEKYGTRNLTCEDCGAAFEATLNYTMCPRCTEKNRERKTREKLEDAQREVEDAWKRFCPPLYFSTNLDDPRMNPSAVQVIEEWKDQGDGIGIGFRGASGRGKTRLGFALLRWLHLEANARVKDIWDVEINVDAISATRLASLQVESFDDDFEVRQSARERLRKIREVRYLLIDDLGKQKFTERAEVELYDLIETRTSQLRPTFWTANMTSKEFAAMLSNDRAEPIIRRLTEFSKIVTL